MAYNLYAPASEKIIATDKQMEMRRHSKLWKDILADNIFAVCKTPMAASITRRTLAGFTGAKTNVALIGARGEGLGTSSSLPLTPSPSSLTTPSPSSLTPHPYLDMQFDIIIGNPPYQQDTQGHGAQAKPIYQHFVRQAKKLNPRYISLIIPARWFSGGMGLKEFRKEMLNDDHIRVLHDYIDAKNCFPNVEIKGGVCYFLWDREYSGQCKIFTHVNGEVYESERKLLSPYSETFIRFPKQLSIVEKVWSKKTVSLISIVSSVGFFGLATDFFKNPKKYGLPPVSTHKIKGGLTIYGLESSKRVERYVSADYPVPNGKENVEKWKVFVPEALGASGTMGEDIPAKILGDSFVGFPKTLCTFTFLNVGDFSTKNEAENCLTYIKTKFFRFLVGIIKTTQHATQRVYQLVPLQDFGESWTDEKLYKKYGLTSSEIEFIESMIREM